MKKVTTIVLVHLLTVAVTHAQRIDRKVEDGVTIYSLAHDNPDPDYYNQFLQTLKDTWAELTFEKQRLPFGKSVALLCGVSEYDGVNYKNLPYVKNDLVDMKDFLLNRGGFDEVYIMQDKAVTRSRVEKYMKDVLAKRLGKEDRLLFYFSGHGDTHESGRTGYMMLNGAKRKVFYGESVIKINDVQDWSTELPTKHFLCILDCCVSGLGLDPIPKGETKEVEYMKLLQTFSREGSREVITAGTDTEETFEIPAPVGNKGNGVFTAAILKVLNSGSADIGEVDGIITLDELIATVKNEVARFAIQHNKKLTPNKWQLYSTQNYPGTFVFVNTRAKDLKIALDKRVASQLTSRGPDERSASEWEAIADAESDPLAAINFLTLALKIDSVHIPSLKKRAELYMKLNIPAKAIEDFLIVRKSKPDDLETMEKLADAYRLNRSWNEALELYTVILENTGSNTILKKRARCYMALRLYTSSVKDLTRALKFDSTDHEILELRADAYAANHQTDSAIADYSRKLEIQNDPDVLRKRADAYRFEFGDRLDHPNADKFRADYHRAVLLDSSNSFALEGYAYALTLSNNYLQAIQYFKKALKGNPQFTRAQLGLAKAYQTVHYSDSAMDIAKTILKYDANNAKVYETIADINFDRNNIATAVHNYNIAIDLQPSRELYRKRWISNKMIQSHRMAKADSLSFTQFGEGIKKSALVLSGLGPSDAMFCLGVLSFLEDHGMRPDVVVGSGIGAVVGGLYSNGMSASSLQDLFFSSQGIGLFEEIVRRKDWNFWAKADASNYALRIGLSRGPEKSQIDINEVRPSLLLSHYSAESHHNFDEFPTPFVCVLTDMNGFTPAAFTRGNLFQMLTASRAIPLYSPNAFKIDERSFMSGFLSNALPVSVAHELGANKVLAVGVATDPHKKVEGSDAFQGTMINGVRDKTEREALLADHVILNNNADHLFKEWGRKSMYDSGYVFAERSASKIRSIFHFQQDSMIVRQPDTEALFNFSEIKIAGLTVTSRNVLVSRLRIRPGREYTSGQILQRMKKLYADKHLSRLAYTIQRPTSSWQQILVLDLDESKNANIKFGLNYNSDYGVSFLLGADFRQRPLKNAALRLDSRINYSYPKVILSYTHFLPVPFNVGIEGKAQSFVLKNSIENNTKLYYDNISADAYIQSDIWVSSMIQTGVRYNYFLTGRTSGNQDLKSRQQAIYLSYDFDSRNTAYFESSGWKIQAMTDFITNINSNVDSLDNSGFIKVRAKCDYSGELTPWLSIHTGITTNMNLTDQHISPEHRYYLGSNPMNENGFTQFTGLYLMSTSAQNVGVWQARTQARITNKSFVSLIGNLGWLANRLSDVKALTALRSFKGAGVLVGYSTSLGPIQLVVSRSSHEKVVFYANLGFKL